MASLLVTALLTVASAKNVHKYYAEHNYICGVCEAAARFMLQGGDMDNFKPCIDGQGREFSTACSKVREYQDTNMAMIVLNEHQICRELELCGEWEDDMLDAEPVSNPKIVDIINNDPYSTWTAESPERFDGMTVGQFRKTQLGAIVDPDHVYKLPFRDEPTSDEVSALPREHNSVDAWPYCSSITGHVRDQSSCGSCWAFGSTEAFNDRLCISNVTGTQTFLQLMSTEDTAACCSGFQCGFSNGCNGGQPTAAWEWFEREGCPSGGDYDDMGKDDTCMPYSLAPCAHHTTNTTYPACPKREYPTPRCKDSCSNTQYATSFEKDKHYAAKAYSFRSVNSIMQDLVDYGSVTAAFTVYADFPSYKSGVYEHKTGSALGGHAIKIVGYGVEDGVDYWLVINSWNDSWGDGGYFKIKRGTDECGIESQVSSGNPKD